MEICVFCLTQRTLHHFPGNLLNLQHELREREINQRLKWNMPSLEGEELDEFDNRGTIYFVFCRKTTGQVLGTTRLIRTDAPMGYMLLNKFPHAATGQTLPQNDRCFEGSRGVVDHRLTREERRAVTDLFPLAYLEYCVERNAEWIYGLATEEIWAVWTRHGWPLDHLGPPIPLQDGTKGIAGRLPLSRDWLQSTREGLGLNGNILDYGTQRPAWPA